MSRLKEIQEMINYEIEYLNQKINYRKSFRWLKKDLNIDSSMNCLNVSSKGVELSLRSYSESLLASIGEYEKNKIIYDNYDDKEETASVNIDSVKLNIANFYYKELDFDDQAVQLYKEIVKNNSNMNYVNSSLASLSLIEKDAKWDSMLYAQINDSSLYDIIINNSLKKEPYKMIGTMNSDSIDIIYYKDLHDVLFKVNDLENDSLNINNDTYDDTDKNRLIKNEKPSDDF